MYTHGFIEAERKKEMYMCVCVINVLNLNCLASLQLFMSHKIKSI